MAGPHVAGTVTLIWAAQPDLIGNIERTRQIIIETAFSYGTYNCTDEQSMTPRYRVVNAYQAVQAARALGQAPPVPAPPFCSDLV